MAVPRTPTPIAANASGGAGVGGEDPRITHGGGTRLVVTVGARASPAGRAGRLLLAARSRRLRGRGPAGRAIEPGIGANPVRASPSGASSGGVSLSGFVSPPAVSVPQVSAAGGSPRRGGVAPVRGGLGGVGIAVARIARRLGGLVAVTVSGGVFGQVDQRVEGVGVGVFAPAGPRSGFEDPVDDRIQHGVEQRAGLWAALGV